ncbi:hypothetical protein I79_016509 [Cricetulus griseus]|uniref:Uncharacterized protein n=1 Tax=Cricetulus griseus TaxID=10029 RepID=G3HZK3_CRIGR|nr:hypothetical protein I79_016509 [Cricetulus griseus]
MRRRLRFCRDAWLTLLLSAALGLLLYAQRDGAAPTTRAPPARGQSPRGPLLVSGDAGSPTTPARPRRPMRATPQCRPHLRAPLTSADICAPRINGASRCSLTNRVNAAETAHLAARRICSSRSSLWPPTSSGGKPYVRLGAPRVAFREHSCAECSCWACPGASTLAGQARGRTGALCWKLRAVLMQTSCSGLSKTPSSI